MVPHGIPSLAQIFVAGALGLIAVAASPAPPALAQTNVIQSQDSNIDGVVAEITQAQRKEGVLTIRLRVRNTSDSDKLIRWPHSTGDFDKYYLVAGNRKYLVLRDSKGELIAAVPVDGTLRKGGGFTWWAKFPAPPASEKKFSFFTSITPPFEDVPISD